MKQSTSLPIFAKPSSLFLDIDGTLIDFADHPDRVQVRPGTTALLSRLHTTVEGALALVSGRSIDIIDTLFSPLTLPCAGLHGLERRNAFGETFRQSPPTQWLEPFRQGMSEFARLHDGVLFEDKRDTLALHYRQRPDTADTALALMESLMDQFGHDANLLLLKGNMVLEIRPEGFDKGTAIEAFMGETPFAGRTPVFIGDDTTDEHGFAVVNMLDGHSIKVGCGETAARSRLNDIDAVMQWLNEYADYMEVQ